MLKLGVSACFFHADPQRAIFKGKTLLYLEQSMSHWLMGQNVMVVLIPPPATASSPILLKHYVDELDGLVLQGGSDVSPQSYGEIPLKPEWSGDFIRDQYEIALVREYLAQEKPILGICRGLQLLNVACGGTLYQDIGTQLPKAISHRNWDIYDQNTHEIRAESGSLLSRLSEQKKLWVNSIHHQAIKDLGKGLLAEARAVEDGVIEAVRLDSPNFVYAMQWHPEFHANFKGSANSTASTSAMAPTSSVTPPTAPGFVPPLDLLPGEPLLQEFLTHVRQRKNRS